VSPAIPKGQNSAALADWLEATLLVGESKSISHVRIERLLNAVATDVADEELDGDDDEVATAGGEVDLDDLGVEAEAERDVRLDLLIEEIETRAKLGSNVYPLKSTGQRVEAVDSAGARIYLVLLALGSSEAKYRKDRRAHEMEKVFDTIALEAMRRYLGRDAQGVRFARNSSEPDDPDTRPRLFSDAVKWLRDRLDLPPKNEPVIEDDELHWEWDEERLPRLNTSSDAGVDVVVWWRFQDGRPGNPVLLVQCTVQLTWENKLADIPLVLWEEWINFSMVPPQTALVIPFGEDPTDRLWRGRSKRAGVVIDRLRLLELLSELSSEALERMVLEEDADWATKELQSVE
jgi:hypothetical protein